MKFSFKKGLKGQKGFTLVELSIVVLVAGLMLTAVMKGQSMIEGARAQKLLNDVKNVEALIGQYSNQKGRLPGDCNRDGVIDFDLNTAGAATYGAATQVARATLYDYSGDALSGVATDATGPLAYCAEVGGSTVTMDQNANRWINDLRNGNVISRNTTNRLFAKHVAEDFIYVGKWATTPTTTEDFNAITVASVPVAMAKRILMNVNGSETNSDNGQIRVLTDAGAIEASTTFAPRSNNEVVSLIYFYRNQPVPGTGS